MVDINCDMGESFGAYRIGNDAAIMPWITSANIACGFHAGDPLVMDAAIQLASKHGVSVGAHPGYPDLQGFGRRNMDLTPEEVEAFTLQNQWLAERDHGAFVNASWIERVSLCK